MREDVELATVPIHRSLTRPLLANGGEREPMIMLWLTVFSLIFIGLSVMTFVVAIILLFTGTAILRFMAKADPFMFGIYRRHISYGGYKHGRATPWGVTRRVRNWGV